MRNCYSHIIPRLDGDSIRTDFERYRLLVRKGIAGFIVFGGRLEEVRLYLRRLQEGAASPLIIASDLERGLGQQLRGGTLFPPAMALARAVANARSGRQREMRMRLVREAFRATALEASYAGINTILAPVLDINTNPKNPIISVRAFGEDADTVSLFGKTMIRAFQRDGIAACGKHFPGHGDTEVDSHIRLPVIRRGLKRLESQELRPFEEAIKARVKLIMLGHLNVPAIDRKGTPLSLSERAVSFLRGKMGFKGLLITDAMNMGGIGMFSEEDASAAALRSGVDLILHPSSPEAVAERLEKERFLPEDRRLNSFRGRLPSLPADTLPSFESHRNISRQLTVAAIDISDAFTIRKRPFLILLSDEQEPKGGIFSERLRAHFPGLQKEMFLGAGMKVKAPEESFVIVAVFSETKAWKGGARPWLLREVQGLAQRADLLVSFGSPYLLDGVKGTPKMLVYWDSDDAQKAAADALAGMRG